MSSDFPPHVSIDTPLTWAENELINTMADIAAGDKNAEQGMRSSLESIFRTARHIYTEIALIRLEMRREFEKEFGTRWTANTCKRF